MVAWWALQDLNLGPMDYESTALTAELRALRDLSDTSGRLYTELYTKLGSKFLALQLLALLDLFGCAAQVGL